MKRIAITGGIGAGKSVVSHYLRKKHGYCVWDADVLAREALNDASLHQPLADFFGPDLFTTDGFVRRSWLRDRIFSRPAEREVLEKLIHPKIAQLFAQKTLALQELAPDIWFFYEASLIFEVGRAHLFDARVVVRSDENIRTQRLHQHRKLSLTQIQQVMATQWSDEAKCAQADFVIENNQDKVELELQVQYLLDFLGKRFSAEGSL